MGWGMNGVFVVTVVLGGVPLGPGLCGSGLRCQWSAGPGTFFCVVVVVVGCWLAPWEPHATTAEPMTTAAAMPSTADKRRRRSHLVGRENGSSVSASVFAIARVAFVSGYFGIGRRHLLAEIGRDHGPWVAVMPGPANPPSGFPASPSSCETSTRLPRPDRERVSAKRFLLSQIGTTPPANPPLTAGWPAAQSARLPATTRISGCQRTQLADAQQALGQPDGLKGEAPRVSRKP
jgi:hypothetical protein